MRRSTTAIVLALLAVGFLLAAPELRGWALIGCVLAFVVAIPITVRRRAGKNAALGKSSALVPWAVSLVISAVVIVPQLVREHYRRAGAHVFVGLIWWVTLAALLRLAIFLADYFRKRRNGFGAKT